MTTAKLWFVLFTLSTASPVLGQTAQEWVERGHRAASEDRHAESIVAYQRALDLDPSLRPNLLASLGRQYLWAGDAVRAATLLAEFVAANPDSPCDVRNDYGLALSWSDQPDSAVTVLERVANECSTEANTARLRLAAVYRWQGNHTRAGELYDTVIATGDAEQVTAARVGLGYVALLRDYNRAAARQFADIDGREAAEGHAIALARMGEFDAARALVASSPDTELSDQMADLRDYMQRLSRSELRSDVTAYRDADGTAYTSVAAHASRAIGLVGRAGIGLSQWSLSGAAAEPDGFGISGDVDYRFSRAVAAQARVGRALARGDVPDRWTGELNAVVTPSDAIRIDVGAARITVMDNVAAVMDGLAGTHVSIGTDIRLTPAVTAVAAADATDWSTGNVRTRLRGALRWRTSASGAPLTLELPVLLQRYDEPMPYVFFSPAEYLELGPSANLELGSGEQWAATLLGQAGGQRETGFPWRPFVTTRGTVATVLAQHWTVRATLGWSNSNLASSASFERTTFVLGVTRVLPRD